ncbi:IS3 family transposase [Gordonia bronchialis]|uniref:IS3 family transposase n=1 Tax=Gordonia bronchialis TaxID=2054 RepID=UPI001D149F8E|nr:IS3 family transposase [Gordonia bronchialis]
MVDAPHESRTVEFLVTFGIAEHIKHLVDARKNPRHGFRRAWAHLRFDDGIEINKKKVHRLWKEEGLQVRRAPPQTRRPVIGPGRCRGRAEGGVGIGLSVRFHRGWEEGQDRFDG